MPDEFRCVLDVFFRILSQSSSVYLLTGGSLERRGSEDEAGYSPWERAKPCELLKHSMDSKEPWLSAHTSNTPRALKGPSFKIKKRIFYKAASPLAIVFSYTDLSLSYVPSNVWLLMCQEGLCSFVVWSFLLPFLSIGRVKAAALTQEGCTSLTVAITVAMHPH